MLLDGDQDMAAHLLREAPDRLEASFLPESDPALNTWMEGKRVAWNLDADEYAHLDNQQSD